jgi:hypothetical protein
VHYLVYLHHAFNANGRVPDYSDDVLLPMAVVPKWCQKHLAQTPEHPLLPRIWHTYAESERVTDGTRTRALRSHNPTTSVATGCRALQNRLRYADFFARRCQVFLRIALCVVSEMVSTWCWQVPVVFIYRSAEKSGVLSRKPVVNHQPASSSSA